MRGLLSLLLSGWCIAAPAAAAEVIVIDPSTSAPDVLIPDEIPADEGETPPPETAGPAKAEKMPPLPPPEPPAKAFNAVRLQGLNKVTARISTLDAPLGAVTNFGNLEIIAKRCWQAPPEDRPESAALLEIRELKRGETPQTVFSGWMYASSPALSALEHPVYDVTVIACEAVDTLE